MKKTNLEQHMNEIIFDVITKKRDLDIEMFTIYQRETGKNPDNIEDIVKWFSDVPRETLYLSESAYKFIKEYFNTLKEYNVRMVKEPLNDIICLGVLIKIGVIPSRYSQTPLDEFMQIIRLKESRK